MEKHIENMTRAGSNRRIGPKMAEKLAKILTTDDPSTPVSDVTLLEPGLDL